MHQLPKSLSLLIYGDPAREASRKVADPELGKLLQQVGYQVSYCKDPDECRKSMAQKHVDMVLADHEDVSALKDGNGGKVVFVPVLIKPTKDQLKQAQSEYGSAYDVG